MNYTFEMWVAGDALPNGWDVADAVEDGWTAKEVDAFMKARAKLWEPPKNDPPPPKKVEPEPQKAVTPIKQDQPEPSRGAVAQISKPKEEVKQDDNWRQDFVTNDEGVPKATVTINWALLLRHHPAMNNALAFDAFRLQIVLLRRPAWELGEGEWTPRTLRESDYQKAVMWLESLRMTPKVSTIAPVISAVAEMQQFDALREYLEGLVWDGVPRVDGFFRMYAGALGDSEYPEIVSRRFLISAVARGLKPGCKVDTMPILEGAQGLKKSTLLKTLFGAQFFSDELSEIGSKDAKMEMQGVWGIEIAEMHRMNAAETNAVKKFMSQSTDRFRPPYGRTVIEAARRLVLAGTINPDGNPYLRDSTGARRFWPITVTSIDIEGVQGDRDQIWAEAVHRFKQGEPWWAQADELDEVEDQQHARTEVDVWTDAVLKALEGRSSILLSDLIREVGIPAKDASQHHASRIGRIMKSCGWVSVRDRTGGADRMKFVKPEEGDDVVW